MKSGDLKLLEDRLGHEFDDKALLLRALTHASALQNGASDDRTYERLEFLGDRVLGLVIADMLDQAFPEALEGELSRRLARLVSGETCTEVARDMDLHRFVRVGDSMQKSGGRATNGILADVCESVIGALYRDGGMEPARRAIEQFWRARLEDATGPLRDAKTELQEWAHRRGLETPTYLEVMRTGPDHAPEFEVEVVLGEVPPARGRGRSKRQAEHEAAAFVLRREGVWSPQ